jgi:hypothetical protein
MEYLALLLPMCPCWRARHLLAATAAAALIIAAAGSRGGTASLAYLLPVLAVTFLLSYRLGNAGGWRTIAGPALLAATAEVTNRGFNPFLLMVTFGPWAAGEFVRSRRHWRRSWLRRQSCLRQNDCGTRTRRSATNGFT